MKRLKLIEKRKQMGFSQEYMASVINIDRSCYARRENGQIPISDREWEKLAGVLRVSVDEIYEPNSSQTHIMNGDNAIGQNIIYTVPKEVKDFFDLQQKYIKVLEEKLRERRAD